MLNKLDDYPVHQTPEPLAHPATSDRNVYDRTWFNGYAEDGSWFFGIGMAIYPHRGVLDCAFSVVQRDGIQHCFFGSRRAPRERTDMSVGPFRIEVIEPMRRARVVLDDNTSGLGSDITFSARSAAVQEARQTLWRGPRRTMDATRFARFGTWEGAVHTPDGDLSIEPELCRGTKDRSWGVRGVGEPEQAGAPAAPGAPPGGAFFLWAPLFWPDHATHAMFFDGTRGEPPVREALRVPLYSAEDDVPGVEDDRTEHYGGVVHRIEYHDGTRLAQGDELDLLDLDGKRREVVMEPILRFQMKGLGYSHPKWRQGAWQGELETGHDSFDPQALDLLKPENVHVQQVVFGPYAPAGFESMLDGAR